MDEERLIPWQEHLDTLLRHRRLILLVFATSTLTAAVLAYMQAPAYLAAATLMVSSERPRLSVSPGSGSTAVIDRVTDQDLNSEAALLKSVSLIREVLEPLRGELEKLEERGIAGWVKSALAYPMEIPATAYRTLHGLPSPSRFDEWVRQTHKVLNVSPIAKSNLIQVTFAASSPEWAAGFVNTLVKRHVERHASFSQTSEAHRFFESQRQLLSTKARNAERALNQFYEREGIGSVPEQRALLRKRLADLTAALAGSDTQMAETSARAAFLDRDIQAKSRRPRERAAASERDPLQLIRARIVELELQRGQLLAKFAPTSLMVQDIDRQMAEAKALLEAKGKEGASTLGGADPTALTLEVELAKAQAEAVAVKARTESLREQIATTQKELTHLDQIASEQERLEQDVATAKESYLTYLRKEEETRFSNALDESMIVNVTVAEEAKVPTVPESSRSPLVVGLGAILGLCAAVGLAFVRDRLDPSVKSAAEAQRLTDLPVLADIPA